MKIKRITMKRFVTIAEIKIPTLSEIPIASSDPIEPQTESIIPTHKRLSIATWFIVDAAS